MTPTWFIGDRLAQLIAERNTTASALSSACGIHDSTLCMYLRNASGARPNQIARIAAGCGMTPEEFLASGCRKRECVRRSNIEDKTPCGYRRALAIIGGDYLDGNNTRLAWHDRGGCFPAIRADGRYVQK